MSLLAYTKSVLNPFDKGVAQPKLLDGKVARSSGIRLKSTGTISCNPEHTTYIALFPGRSNVLCWTTDVYSATSKVKETPEAFQSHLDSAQDRANTKASRVVGAALRLALVNNPEQNEGYWEAARIPTNQATFSFNDDVGYYLSRLGFELPTQFPSNPGFRIVLHPISDLFTDEAQYILTQINTKRMGLGLPPHVWSPHIAYACKYASHSSYDVTGVPASEGIFGTPGSTQLNYYGGFGTEGLSRTLSHTKEEVWALMDAGEDVLGPNVDVDALMTSATPLYLGINRWGDWRRIYFNPVGVSTKELPSHYLVDRPGIDITSFDWEVSSSSTTVSMALNDVDLANHHSYQSGRLRDIGSYMFKVNSIDDDMNYTRIPLSVTASDFVSDQWDTIIIKIHGRDEPLSPSVLMFDCVSCQEVIYKENTIPARLMTASPYVEQTKAILSQRKELPGDRVSPLTQI